MPITLDASEIVTALALGIVGTLVVAVLHKTRRTRLTSKEGYPLPPGPPARSFWENIIPTEKSECVTKVFSMQHTNPLFFSVSSTFNYWANEYGPVFTLRRGSEIAIVIARVNVRRNFSRFPLD